MIISKILMLIRVVWCNLKRMPPIAYTKHHNRRQTVAIDQSWQCVA